MNTQKTKFLKNNQLNQSLKKLEIMKSTIHENEKNNFKIGQTLTKLAYSII